MLEDLIDIKKQISELLKDKKEMQEKAVEKVLTNFMNIIINNDIPLENKNILMGGFKTEIINIFEE